MPEKKTEAEKKEKARMAAMRRLVAYQKSLRQPSKKKPVKKEKESWVERLKKKVQKHFKRTKRTKDIQRQLKKSDTKFKTDQEKAEEKKRKGR